jgi:hypothetical protein
MMDDKARTALRDLVMAQGESVLASRDRLRGLLSDECPECNTEITVLMIAVQAQVPSELRAYSSDADTRFVLNAGVLRLERAFGLARPAAAWAVLSLAYAIGRIQDEQFQSLLVELSVDSTAPSGPDRPTAEPKRPPTPPPRQPPPRPVSEPTSPPTSHLALQPGSAGFPNANPSVLPPKPGAPGAIPSLPVPPARSKRNLVGLGIGGGALLTFVVINSLMQHSPAPDLKPSVPPDSQPSQSQPPAPDPRATQPTAQGGSTTYSDSSGLFQVMVPADWEFRRAETDTTLDNTACHLVKAVVFARQAERSDLDGWVSEGIRVTIYLPAKDQVWEADWAADWQRKVIGATLAGYSKFQNTAVEPVQLGNIPATTTAVMGEGKAISEPEVARIYVGVSQKFLVTVEVAMPSSKRPMFESADETVRRTFEMKVP